ncbi:MAG: phenylalanine--tRNA ligase subunit beta [Clostridiales Family XIII bacterium]|jgi:phenylalanyl-tRNA synthetase beta chain|nr:phenylalanine--tRNA ligase subunit beta [Clostridiales Family XIII bacterium]
MLVPLNWIKEYVDIDAGIDEFCERMIMSGSNLEGVRTYGEGLHKIVIGKVLSVKPHENSDHLVVGLVEVGAEAPVQIVTGAQNVTEGAYVPVALVGSVLPDGLKIKKGRLRGVDSYGMMCSAQELGFDDKVVPIAHKDGIWLLEGEYEPGTDFAEAVGLRNDVVDFEITPNRPDCLSIIGMAREAAATFDKKLRLPDTRVNDAHEKKASDFISVEVKNPELCSRYIARVVTDVKIEQSPWWMQKRLMLAGMRPINNIVDITNYVLLEYGHPLHAFDIRTVEGGKIIVDTAEEGEKFVTLDGSERLMSGDTLMIKDAAKPIGIAGVMGGLNSEIQNDTETILIECACFNSDCIRLTSKKLGLRTEASARYEKGISPELAKEAADRVCALIVLLGAGRVVSGAVDIYAGQAAPEPIKLRVSRVNKVLGGEMSGALIKSYLERLEMKVAGAGDSLEVLPHYTRLDLKEEVDLIEEAARIHGYDKLGVTLPGGGGIAVKPRSRSLCDAARGALTGMGYNEIQTYSFVSPKGVETARIPEEGGTRDFVRLINPLGEENSVMRTVLLPNLLEVLGRNYSRNIEAARAFEIGNTFRMAPASAADGITAAALSTSGGVVSAANDTAANSLPTVALSTSGGVVSTADDAELPKERISMSIGLYGNGVGFFTLKGALETLFGTFGLTPEYRAERDAPTYHPGRCAAVYLDGERIGTFGELHPDAARRYGIGVRCYVGEVDMESVAGKADVMRYYRPLPKYPSVDRDMALVVDEEVTVRELTDVIRSHGGKILESVKMFDVYRGKQIGEGKKSVAFNLVYRSAERTLTDEEAALEYEKTLTALSEKLGAVLRDI